MRNKYKLEFTSKNEPTQKFTLTFTVEQAMRTHSIQEMQVYQHTGDIFCGISQANAVFRSSTHSFRVTSITGYLKFSIDISITPTGCTVVVIEQVITTIECVENLQPCN